MSTDSTKRHPNLFRFGMQLRLPQGWERVDYYGRGPWENYCNRNSAARLGVWRQTVDEQFYPYVRAQENGTKTDVRWLCVSDGATAGLRIAACEPFSTSALHYTIEDLDCGPNKANIHSPEVPRQKFVNLLVDKRQMGVPCIDSWSAVPSREYMLPYQDYDFTFTLQPHRLNR